MTTNYIDIGFHGSTLPATYIIPGGLRAAGCTDTATLLAGNIMADLEDDDISGYFTGAGNAVVIPIGFNPVRVQVVNWTDGIKAEWLWGAPATDTLKAIANPATVVAAGGGTVPANVLLDANSLIVVTPVDGTPGSNGSVTFAAALAVNAKVLSFRIEG